MSGVDAPAPWRIAFDNARDPYTARNALGAEKIGGGGGGGGGAPDNAEYIVAATDATLTAERVLTNTASITWDFTTPGQAKASTAAGGGNVSNSGTPTLGQYAKWVTATTIQGVSAATVLGDIGAQPLDADLTAIAALTGTNTIYYRSASNVWSPVVVSTGLAFSGGNLTCTVSTSGLQPLDATLTALAAYNTNGLLTQTAADTFTGRTLTGPAAGITVSNGNGVAGNPTLALADDLAALEALTGTDTIYYRSGTSAWTAVTIGTNLTFTGGTLSAAGGGGGGGDVFLAGANVFTNTNTFQGGGTTVQGLTGNNASMSWTNYQNAAGNPNLLIRHSRGTTIGAHAAVAVADPLGQISFQGSDGAAFASGAVVQAYCEATPVSGHIQSNLRFYTDSGATLTERMRIDGAGAVTVTRTPPATSDNSTNVATTAWVQSVLGAGVPSAPQGRLTLQVGTPVMTTTQAAQTTLIYHPYCGNLCPIYNGSTFTMTPLAPSGGAISIGTTDTTRNPSAIGASKVNDWFVWDGGAGFLYLSHGPDWTNDTTRSAGTALVMVNGILLNSVTIGNGTTTGPAASRGTYVGTTRSNASSQLDWILPSAAAGGGKGTLGVWNAYNRVLAGGTCLDTTSSWVTSSTTIRAKNNSANNAIAFVSGLQEDVAVVINAQGMVVNAANSTSVLCGIGVDTTTAFTSPAGQGSSSPSENAGTPLAQHIAQSFGYHTWTAVEATNVGTTNVTTYGVLAGPPARNTSSLTFWFPM